MKVKWSFEREDQIKYYINQARGVQNGFFQSIHSILLPRLNRHCWYLPDYDLFANEDFKKKLGFVNRSVFTIKDKKLMSYVDEKLDETVSREDVEKDIKHLEKEQEEFFRLCKIVFPRFYLIRTVTIVPTKFGTSSSYFELTDESTNKYSTQKEIDLVATYRLDFGVHQIFQSIIAELIWLELKGEELDLIKWRSHRIISEFLTSHTSLASFFHDIDNHKTLEFLENQKGDVFEESKKYFAKMGYPIESSFAFDENTIFYNEKPIIGLSDKEIELVKLLIDHKSQIVGTDEIADVLWKDKPDKFSLYALTKEIERIRTTFEENNIPSSSLRTVRKRGYLLFD